MFNVRSNEPKYAFLWDKETKANNRYGKSIELTNDDSDLHGVSLNINGDCAVGENPNRYKQHGFYLNADNCIGCHACEAACSEKNDNPGHIAFRSVGFVEGGTYPDYQRLNISMACNHCDDPVCLKGCPTRAYTKYAEYGAVLQDPDICFGCGYCTWVCPYNAPQLDPVKGEVSKCNMCVDRLEVGLKPACVSACLGNALDFGVIENVPDNREQSKTEIPGFPRTDITNPNIRFQQTRQTNRDMTRTDSMPLKYHKDEKVGVYKPVLDPKKGKKKHSNWAKLLLSHESSHVAFTLVTQAAVGGFLLMILGALASIPAFVAIRASASFTPLLIVFAVLMSFGLFKLNMHLGKPHRFYRGFYNLRHSPVSREIAGVSLFFGGLLGYTFFNWLAISSFISNGFAVMGVIFGPVGVYYMYKLYRIKARPYWDHWQTASTFIATSLSLSTLIMALVLQITGDATPQILTTLAMVATLGLTIEGIGHIFHARDLQQGEGEAQASWYEQTTKFAWPFYISNGLLIIGLLISIWLIFLPSLTAWLLLAVAFLSVAIIKRSLFFALVIPTTMPGAFFWKNKAFQEHAKETGLAKMQQVGVEYDHHRQFKVGELLTTIKESSFKEAVDQVKAIFNWKRC